MELSKKLIDAINEQINLEQWSSQLYLSMALDADDKSLLGTASWMKMQAAEEAGHANAMIAYLQKRNVRPSLKAIKDVPTDFGNVLEMFEETLTHERAVSDSIIKIVALAIKEKDFGAENFFREFVTEQEEEENSVMGIIDRFKLAGEAGMIFVDQSLGKRQA